MIKSTLKAIVSALATCMLFQVANAQDLEKAKDVAQRFAEKLGTSPSLQVVSEEEASFEFDSGAGPIVVSKSGFYVSLWMSKAPEKPWQEDLDAEPTIKNEDGARRAVALWTEQMGITNDDYEKGFTRTSWRSSEPDNRFVTVYGLVFRDRPYQNTFGLNSRTYEVNAFTGKVEAYMAVQGVHYDEAVIQKSGDEAADIAKRRIQELYPGQAIGNVAVTHLSYASDGARSEFRIGAPVLWPMRRARLAYVVVAEMLDESSARVSSCSVTIDAETGRVMNGGVSKGTNPVKGKNLLPPTKLNPKSEHSQSNPNTAKAPQLSFFYGVFVAIIGAASIWLLRKKLS